MIEKIKKKLIALLQSFCNLLHSVFVEKNRLSYDEKLRLALENDDLIYEEMHEEYKVPYSKRGLIFWRIMSIITIQTAVLYGPIRLWLSRGPSICK